MTAPGNPVSCSGGGDALRSPPSEALRPGLDGIVWPALPDPAGGMALALQWQLARTERLPQAVLRSQQMRQVAGLMVQAATIPFWRDRLRAAGLSPGVPPEEEAWARLPVLTRSEIRQAGASLFAPSVPASHGALRHLATSGSTGHPVTIHSTGLAHFFWNGFLLREALWHGFDFAATMVTIVRNPVPSASLPLGTVVPEGVVRPDWGMPFSPLFATGPAAALDNRLSVAEQCTWLRRMAPGYLHAKPATLHDLARHCLEHGITIPGLRAVRSFAAPVTSALRGLCREAWGVEVVSAYSAEESGYLALQCPQQPHYHVQSEGVLLEVLRDNGSACTAGEIGRVVVTPLHNFAMPLLRYELGDYAEVGAPCPCGRTLPVLKRIVGRARSRLRMPDGQRRFPDNCAQDFTPIPAIHRYQIAQVACDLVEVRMVVTAPLTAAQEAALTDALAVSLGHRFPLRFVVLPALPDGPGGKFLDIVCELPAADAA